MMNRFAFENHQQQNNHSDDDALVSYGEMMMMNGGVICPKPRRLRLLNPSVNDSVISSSSSRRHHSYLQIRQNEIHESNASTELLDMILTKECYDGEKANLLSSSPPFFCGSPPNRASNPLVQDALFGREDPNPFSHAFEASPSSSARGSCARGQKHPIVRVVGFNSRGISAVA